MSMGRPGHGRGRFEKKNSKAKDTRATVLRIASYMKNNIFILLLILVSVIAASLLSVAGPYFMGRAIDDYLEAMNLAGYSDVLMIMFLVYLGSGFFSWLMSFLTVKVAQDAVMKIRADLFNKMQSLSLKYFDSHSDGDLTSRLTNDVDNISNTLNQSLTQLISSGITIVAVVFMMFKLSWQLSLVSFIMIPLIIFITGRIAVFTRKFFKDKMTGLGELNGHIEETISGQKVVKAYGQEEAVIDVFKDKNKFYKESAIKADIMSSILGPIMNMMNNLNYAFIALVGGVLIINGLTSLGVVVTFVNYSRQFARPINQIASLYNTIQGAIAGAERVFEVIDEKPEITSHDHAIVKNNIDGDVSFKDVNFSYVKGQPILKDINFNAKPGNLIALVGPTGAGKTTIINLLTRFYDIDSGNIEIDGVKIKDFEVENLRSKLGIVLQDTYLFTGTVMENIRYGRLNASAEEVIEASKLSNAHQFIHRLPDGYDTMLTGDGHGISQGQRQLLAIARTILANPNILILDEATSSVDTRTEKHIQEGLLNLMDGRTSFVIAHRLSTIQSADEILVINEGNIIERGNHEDLLNQTGFYHDLYYSQFKSKVS